MSDDTAAARMAAIRAKRDSVMDGGRPEAVAKQHGRGRMTARERVAAMLDPGSFREIGALVEPMRDTDLTSVLEAPADGIVAGRGTIEGRPVYILADDFTVLGGSVGPIGSDKTQRLMDLAERTGYPLVWLQEGAGHRIQDGLDSRHFVSAGPLFWKLGRLSGRVPVVTAVLGPGSAGPTNIAAFADFTVMWRGRAQMGIGGPPLVKAATGQDIDTEDLGGAAVQADRQGMADMAPDTEEACFAALRRYLSFMPSNSEQLPPVTECKDPIDRRSDDLSAMIPDSPRRSYDMRKVLQEIVDRDSFFEIKPTHAKNITTAFARLGGRPVALIANNPQFLAGMLDAKASEKAARHIAIADAYGLPLVYFIDVPGIMVGSDAEASTLGLRSGKLLYELAVATVPRYSVVVRKGYGGAYYAMNGGRGFHADGCWVWPTSDVCAMSIETALNVAYRRDWQNAPDPAARKAELEAEIRTKLTPLRAAEHFGIDDVIDPAETRQVLAEAIAIAPARPHDPGPRKKRAISPI
ncbi:acyl-CoA carboxylase subunit beta [Minwuia sp.]|uniref:acyl-CoA carboxylase subunit beta n=1 Tax=Minwuia sp. TaxID=2493630 RepID=UPI003A8DF709